MKVLIFGEFSGRIREAFRQKGHDAWSCDLLPSEIEGKHIQGDGRRILGDGWDLMIGHPDCTYLTASAEWAYKDPDFARYPNVGYHMKLRTGTLFGAARRVARDEAVEFFRALLDCSIPRVCLENPVGCISSRIRKPDQTIQPWMFGEDASKSTCLWLKNLPLLQAMKPILRPRWIKCECCDESWCQGHQQHAFECPCPPVDDLSASGVDPFEFYYSKYYANQTPTGQNKLGPSPTRSAERSRTFQGIARAMAEQWG